MFSSNEYLWLLTNMCTQGFPSTPLLTAIKEASNFSTSFTNHNTALKINKLNNLWPHCESNKILGFWSCHSPRVKITSTGNIWTQTSTLSFIFKGEAAKRNFISTFKGLLSPQWDKQANNCLECTFSKTESSASRFQILAVSKITGHKYFNLLSASHQHTWYHCCYKEVLHTTFIFSFFTMSFWI